MRCLPENYLNADVQKIIKIAPEEGKRIAQTCINPEKNDSLNLFNTFNAPEFET